jgi:hypothetical protein
MKIILILISLLLIVSLAGAIPKFNVTQANVSDTLRIGDNAKILFTETGGILDADTLPSLPFVYANTTNQLDPDADITFTSKIGKGVKVEMDTQVTPPLTRHTFFITVSGKNVTLRASQEPGGTWPKANDIIEAINADSSASQIVSASLPSTSDGTALVMDTAQFELTAHLQETFGYTNMGGNRLSDVADGVEDTDVATVGQLGAGLDSGDLSDINNKTPDWSTVTATDGKVPVSWTQALNKSTDSITVSPVQIELTTSREVVVNGTPKPLSSVSKIFAKIEAAPNEDNVDTVYYGNDSVTTSTGIPLSSMSVTYWKNTDISTIYLIGTNNDSVAIAGYEAV